MYKCLDCEASFNEPNEKEETMLHTELSDGGMTEVFVSEYCPECGSENIEDRYTCVACRESAVANDADALCEHCAEQIFLKLEVLSKGLQEDYKMDENEVLEAISDWMDTK